MFTIEEFLRISNQMRDYYAKKIKDSFNTILYFNITTLCFKVIFFFCRRSPFSLLPYRNLRDFRKKRQAVS